MTQITEPTYYIDLDIKIPLGDFILNIMCVSYEPPNPEWNVDNHSHSCYELHLIPSGKGVLYMDGKEYSLSKDSFYLTGPEIYHEQRTDSIDPMAEYALSFEIKQSSIKHNNSLSNIYPEQNYINKILTSQAFWIGKDEYGIISLFEKMFSELENKKVGCYTYATTLVTQILVSITRCFANVQEINPYKPVKSDKDSRRYYLDFYLYQYYDKLTLPMLAELTGISLRHINRIISQYYKMSFSKKLMEIKLQSAKNLLSGTDLELNDIIRKIGFKSSSHFYSSFKNAYKMTPLEYRKRSKKGRMANRSFFN